MTKYKLNVKNDVDVCTSRFSDDTDYLLHLPYGFRFSDEVVHIRGFDSMKELKEAAKKDVVLCDCQNCKEGLMKQRIAKRLGYA
jgi:predicted neutral ceramidase superfamily lipid hydrolase